ncbi:hypothetical protein [Pseudomonas glycinae]|uniref:hypothetical protein n=1 Tax=Pseudomonas glycinae TaxID=1785145 RepID=UPI002B1E2B46|nr:hypothetical protein [Pseudomonas glycinae]
MIKTILLEISGTPSQEHIRKSCEKSGLTVRKVSLFRVAPEEQLVVQRESPMLPTRCVAALDIEVEDSTTQLRPQVALEVAQHLGDGTVRSVDVKLLET